MARVRRVLPRFSRVGKATKNKNLITPCLPRECARPAVCLWMNLDGIAANLRDATTGFFLSTSASENSEAERPVAQGLFWLTMVEARCSAVGTFGGGDQGRKLDQLRNLFTMVITLSTQRFLSARWRPLGIVGSAAGPARGTNWQSKISASRITVRAITPTGSFRAVSKREKFA